jgi:small subunit ribosomal protein S1
LLHVSDMSWVRKVSHPSDVVAKGDKVKCVILNVDQERKRVALGLKQMASDPWEGDIPGRYHPGDVKKGKVTKLTNFGVFVELEQGLEGLLHISELADEKVESPEEVVKVGDEIEVKILRVDPADRKIGLSRKRIGEEGVEGEEPPPPEEPPAGGPDKPKLRGGTGSGSSQLFAMPEENKDEVKP